MIGTTGDQELFREYVRENDLGELEQALEPFLHKMPNWLSVRERWGRCSSRIVGVTPIYDNSAHPPDGNRRVKPSSGIMPLARNIEQGMRLIEAWEELFPEATRFCEIRVPAKNIYNSEQMSIALANSGYGIEAVMPNFFTIAGKNHTVNDYAKNKPERLRELPERSWLIPRVLEEVFWNDQIRPLQEQEIIDLRNNLQERYEIRRAKPEDAEGIVNLMQRTYRSYGTFDLATTMPRMIEDSSNTGPMVYVARRLNNHEVVATGTMERGPFSTAEFSDVAVETGNNGGCGLGTVLCFVATEEARYEKVRHFYSDDVPHPGINKIVKRMGARLCGIHENHVRIMSNQLYEEMKRDPLSMDLMVCEWSQCP